MGDVWNRLQDPNMDFNMGNKINEIIFSDRAIKTQGAHFQSYPFSISLMKTYSIIWI